MKGTKTTPAKGKFAPATSFGSPKNLVSRKPFLTARTRSFGGHR